MRASLSAIRNLLVRQGRTLQESIIDDSALVLRLMAPIVDFAAGTEDAREVVRLGGTVRMELRRSEGSAEVESAQTDLWSSDERIVQVLPRLGARETPDRWTTDELVAAVKDEPDLEIEISIHEDKHRWTLPIEEQTGHSVWVGPTWRGFLGWLTQRDWTDVVSTFFANTAGLVLLEDWRNEPVQIGPRLWFASLDFLPPKAGESDRSWPEEIAPHLLRALDIDPSAAPEGFSDVMSGIVGAAAAAAISVRDHQGSLRPHLSSTVRWLVPTQPRGTPASVDAVASLARWVLREPSVTRLEVARQVAAARILDPLKGPASDPVVEAAEIAFRHVVDESIQRALATQAELEKTFRTFDGEMAGVVSGISTALDQVVVRVIAAGLGTAIAALTSEHVRGIPVFLASVSIAGYLIFAAAWQLGSLRSDVNHRFDAFRGLVEARGLRLSDRVDREVARWRTSVNNRVRAVRVGLCVCTIAILVAGGAGASAGRQKPVQRDLIKPSITATPTPSGTAPTPTPSRSV